MKTIRSVGAFVALFTFALSALPAAAQERILSFVSDVHVARNGDLDVIETIRVRAEGRDIRRGILRDFPTTYRRADGTRVEVGFEVKSVYRDGMAEAFVTERLSNGVRVRIGRADVTLRTGEYTYSIAYRATRQVGFFAGYDELYWNATGTGWTFGIDVAEARITLPERAGFLQNAFYTGPQGARGRDATVVTQEPGRIVFRTTRPLPPRNGLTVAAAWPKGIVAEPTAAERAQWWLSDNLTLVIAASGVVLLLIFYVLAWLRVGRDPRRGTVIPLFAPPDGMSAAAVRYVSEMDYDDKTFTAALVDLGVRGRLMINDNGSTYTLVQRAGGDKLPAPERAMDAKLFSRTNRLSLIQSNHKDIAAAKEALEEGLIVAHAGRLFVANRRYAGWGVFGWLVLAAAVIASTFLQNGTDLGGATAFGLLFATPAVATVSGLFEAAWKGRYSILAVAIAGLFAAAFGGAGILVLWSEHDHWVGALPSFLLLAALPVVVLAFSWLEARTREGRAVMDRIEGFRMYLETAEEERLEFLNPPQKTPALFERFLPYAIALDCENSWAARFAGVLASAGTAAAVASWYSGERDILSDPVGFSEHMGSQLSDTVASASSPPGSDSSSSGGGSSGGGSSGGGGGGGGGSGW
jgi:uncharacterized membrane protein YgcG